MADIFAKMLAASKASNMHKKAASVVKSVAVSIVQSYASVKEVEKSNTNSQLQRS